VTADVFHRRIPKGDWELCYIKSGTKKEIIKSAEGLLRSLREDEGFPRAKVEIRFESGRKISIKYKAKNA